MRLRRIALLVAVAGFCCPMALAEPPTDEQLAEYIRAVTEAGKDTAPAERAKARQEAAQDAIAKLNVDELTVAQIDRLYTERAITGIPAVSKALAPRLAELAESPTVDGARAAELRVAIFPPAAGASAEARSAHRRDLANAYAAALKHPAAMDLVRSGKGDLLFRNLGQLSAEHVKEHDLLPAIESLLSAGISIDAAPGLRSLITVVNDEKLGLDAPTRERLRRAMVDAVDGVLAKAADLPQEKANLVKYTKDLRLVLNGAWARGQLLNHPAPDIKFIWSNTKTPVSSFADFKGKVVVVDFWATWCGPCVASFPKLRDLTAHYEGYPVVILGVTSPQGYHYKRSLEPGAKAERIDCKDDVQKELALMSDFVKDMNMTWPVVFSEQNVFNPDFGVYGIPHMAIIDPAGVVRWNGLHPMSANASEKINDLLKEFKLPCPQQTMEESKKADASSN